MNALKLHPALAFRWSQCAGSVQAEASLPDSPKTENSIFGEVTHELGAIGVALAAMASPLVVPDDPKFTPEIVSIAEMYIATVADEMRTLGCFTPRVEERVTIGRVNELNSGFPDCSLWSPGKMTLHVFDLKTGRTPVEHVENWQNSDYAIGLLDEITGGNGLVDQQVTVKMTIVQPRAFHPEGTVRTWVVNGSDLRAIANVLRSQAELANSDSPPTKAGGHCYNCKAASKCHTLQVDAARITDRVESLQLHDLTPEDRSFELDYLEKSMVTLKARLNALTDETLVNAQNNKPTPGYGLVNGRSALIWTKPQDEVIALGELLGIDLRQPESICTPTQAINDKKLDAEVIKAYSKRIPGKLKLARLKNTNTSRMFGANSTEGN